MNLPQGPNTHPLLQLFGFMNDTLGYMKSSCQKYGDLFTIHLGSKTNPTVYVSNPQAIKQIFNRESKEFTSPGNQIFKPVVGEYALGSLTGEHHKRHRRLIMPCLHGSHLEIYTKIIYDTIEKTFEKLTPGQTFSVHKMTEELSGEVILKVLFGDEHGTNLEQLNQLTSAVLDFFGKNSLSSSLLFLSFLRQDLGKWSPWGYVCHLIRQIDSLIYKVIAERRQNFDSKRTDLLNLLLVAKDETGASLSDQELRDELIMLIFAGKDAIASAMAWSVYWVHHLPKVKEKIKQEIESLGSQADVIQITRLPYLTAVYQEILRISPVEIQGQPRIVASPVELMGYQLPVGTVLIPSIYLTHQRPDLYPEPQQFQPERFLEKKFPPHEYLPFGGGSRYCIGSAFSQLSIKLLIVSVILNFQLKLANDEPIHPVLRGLNLIPNNGIPMTFLGKSVIEQSNKCHSLESV